MSNNRVRNFKANLKSLTHCSFNDMDELLKTIEHFTPSTTTIQLANNKTTFFLIALQLADEIVIANYTSGDSNYTAVIFVTVAEGICAIVDKVMFIDITLA